MQPAKYHEEHNPQPPQCHSAHETTKHVAPYVVQEKKKQEDEKKRQEQEAAEAKERAEREAKEAAEREAKAEADRLAAEEARKQKQREDAEKLKVGSGVSSRVLAMGPWV